MGEDARDNVFLFPEGRSRFHQSFIDVQDGMVEAHDADSHLTRGARKDVAPQMDREQVQDMIALSEARTDTKFAELKGSLDLLLAEAKSGRAATAVEIAKLSGDIASMKTDNVRTRSTVRTSAFALASLIVGLTALLAALLFNSFNVGLSLSKVIDERVAAKTDVIEPLPSAPPS